MANEIQTAAFGYCAKASDSDGLYDAFEHGALCQQNKFNSIEEKTSRNMDLISLFVEHLKDEGIEISEKDVLSFFNA
jgi:hypothetical protein